MKTIDITEAKTHLPRLIAEVESGASIVIARDGKPAAKLVPIAIRPERATRRTIAAALKGKVRSARISTIHSPKIFLPRSMVKAIERAG